MNERQRLEQLMQAEGMKSKQFANEIGISPTTLSNIFGGRNKPSLEVMQAVLNRFRSVQSDWLILGVGSMYRPNGDGPQTTLFDIRPELPVTSDMADNSRFEREDIVPQPSVKVQKIVVFYTDGTYEER